MPSSSKNPHRDGRAGRQSPFVPTDPQRRIVMAAKLQGMDNAGIALALGIDRDTLAKHFKAELALANEHIEARIAGNLLSMALDPAHKDAQRASEFVLRSKFKWRTKDELVHQFGMGSDGGEGQPDLDNVQPAKITVEFVNSRPKGLPGAPPEDQ